MLDWNFEYAPFFLECEDGGQSLDTWADGGVLTTLDPDARLALACQVLDAVAAAHSVGVLHKDIKPGHVLISPVKDGGWRVRLTDFGSASLLEPERLAALKITALGMTVSADGSSGLSGSAYYLAPELHAGAAYSVRSDLFSLGVLA